MNDRNKNMNDNRVLETLKGIYIGQRGEDFKTLIKSVLNIGCIKENYINILTNEENMKMYASAFTSELVDENNNYQVLEQLGDLTGNKFIVWYIYDRFPQLRCAEGVKVAARLRINYGSKQTFCEIAEKLGFWPFISATNDMRQRQKKSLLEDVFEAFIGATEMILDADVKHGVGYACAYAILSGIFDEMPISLEYDDLYDSKTRLKEVFDIHGEKLGSLLYEETKEDLITHSTVYRATGPQKIVLGKGSAALKADAQQSAATSAIRTLSRQGYEKKPPAIYARFSKNVPPDTTTEKDVLKVCETKERINEQFPTRGKSKQNPYTSTVLSMYCRKRDYAGIKICLATGADPNIEDSEGMTALDSLAIGQCDDKLISNVLKKLQSKPRIHRHVFDVYFSKYDEKYRNSVVMV